MITIVDIIHHPVVYLKHDVLEIAFCLQLQVQPVQLGKSCSSTGSAGNEFKIVVGKPARKH
jgi:hypothetical protein